MLLKIIREIQKDAIISNFSLYHFFRVPFFRSHFFQCNFSVALFSYIPIQQPEPSPQDLNQNLTRDPMKKFNPPNPTHGSGLGWPERVNPTRAGL